MTNETEWLRGRRAREILFEAGENYPAHALQQAAEIGKVRARAASVEVKDSSRGGTARQCDYMEIPRLAWCGGTLDIDADIYQSDSFRVRLDEPRTGGLFRPGHSYRVTLKGLSFNHADLADWFDLPRAAAAKPEPIKSNNAAKTACFAWLRETYAVASRDNPKKTKAFELAQERWPDLSDRSFKAAWNQARNEGRPWMGQAGAPPKE